MILIRGNNIISPLESILRHTMQERPQMHAQSQRSIHLADIADQLTGSLRIPRSSYIIKVVDGPKKEFSPKELEDIHRLFSGLKEDRERLTRLVFDPLNTIGLVYHNFGIVKNLTYISVISSSSVVFTDGKQVQSAVVRADMLQLPRQDIQMQLLSNILGKEGNY